MHWKIFVIVILFAAPAFAHDHDQEYSQAFGSAYLEGYDHGYRDQQERVGFDYRHDNEFQSAGAIHDSYGSHSDCDSQLGYVEGYADGYFHHPPLIRDTRHDAEAVIGFSDSQFRGASRVYPVGRYEYLEDDWDDKFQSIRIQGRYHVILFDKRGFQGERIELDHDSADLGSFRKKAASMIIETMDYR